MSRTQSADVFWRKKCKRIVVPWLVWGVVTYMLPVLLSPNVERSFIGAIEWITGHNTWIYFVPVLLVCFALFRLVKDRKIVLALVGIGLVSVVLTTLGVYDLPYLTSYQNPLNWFAFFGIGVLLQDTQVTWKNYYGAVSAAVLLVCTVILMTTDIPVGYWTPLSIPVELSAAGALYYLAAKCKNVTVLEQLGRYSYPIFFAHMQFGMGLVNKLRGIMCQLIPALGGVEIPLLRPIAVVMATYGMICLGKAILKLIRLEKIEWIFGI